MRLIRLDREAREDNEIVEGWLLWYRERKQRYESMRELVLHSSPPPMDERPPLDSNTWGDTTGRKAAALADNKAWRWIALVEDVERRLPPKMQVFLRLRREYRFCRGRHGWVAAVQTRLIDELARLSGKSPEDLPVYSDRTLRSWWKRIVEYAARTAAKRGLLS
ncbi:MAG: hypothetical protein AB1327_08060 [Bacillota bacterium]